MSAVRLSSPVSRMPSLHVLASLPNTCIEILHDHQFVRWLHCFQESVQVLCIFFSVTVVYVHCDGDVDGVGRRHSVHQGKTGDFRSSERRQAPQRESVSRASMPSAQRCLSCCSAGARSRGAACVFTRSLVFFHGTAEGVHSGLCCCRCTHVTGQEEVSCLLAQCMAEV